MSTGDDASIARARAQRFLDRFAMGWTDGTVASVRSAGQDGWIRRQLEAPEEPFLPWASDPSAMRARFPPTPGAAGRDYATLRSAMRGRYLARLAGDRWRLRAVMTAFWFEHFNVALKKSRYLLADYLDQAITPNALGRFDELLSAVAHHPAMLRYLDNHTNSVRRGLNENYARELLELHTVGVGRFEEPDVREAARVLSGWGVGDRIADPPDGFHWSARHHDGGAKHVMGWSFPQGAGREEGERLLRLLAASPHTAEHVSRKLLQFFVADEPPPACVARAARAFRGSGGSIPDVIAEVSRCVPRAPLRLKTPLEFLVSAIRVLDARVDPARADGAVLSGLGQPILDNPVPTGFPTAASRWQSASSWLGRFELATRLVDGRVVGVTVSLAPRCKGDGVATGRTVLGDRRLRPGTLASLREAWDGPRSERCRRTIAVALASPEFQTTW